MEIGLVGGHVEFRNKRLTKPSLSDDFGGLFRYLSGDGHVKRVGWSTRGSGSFHTFKGVFVGFGTYQVPRAFPGRKRFSRVSGTSD